MDKKFIQVIHGSSNDLTIPIQGQPRHNGYINSLSKRLLLVLVEIVKQHRLCPDSQPLNHYMLLPLIM